MKILNSNLFIFCCLASLAFLLFSNGINGDFVFDDRSVIIGNPLVERLSGALESFLHPYHYDRPQSGLYRPLTFASYVLNWRLFSGNPAGFHVTNIILHTIVSFFVFLVALNLKDRTTALIAVALFLFLPIHVEAVTSIVGRGELLMFLFFVSAFYAIQKRRYKSASVYFFLSLLGKETGIVFLPIFIFFEFVWRKASVGELFKKALYFAPPLAVYVVLRYNALGSDYFMGTNAYSFFNPTKSLDFFSGLWTAFKVLYLYIQKTVFPVYFSSDYSFNQITAVNNLFGSWQALAGLAIFIHAIYLSTKKRNGLIGLGAFVFLSSYLIISNFVIKIGTIMAERLMYLPSFGFVLIIAGYISHVYNGLQARPVKQVLPVIFGRKTPFVLFIILLVVYGIQVIRGNALWKNEKTLFENAYKHAPSSVVNITNMASILFREGKNKEALEKTEVALGIESQNSPTLHLAGQIYKSMGEDKMAEEFWQRGVEVQPDYLYPYLSLGALYYQRGDFKSGERILLKANEMYSTPNVITLLALNKVGLNKYSEAVDLIEKKFGEKPREYELRFILGVAYLKSGDESKARELLLGLKDPFLTEEAFLQKLKNTKMFNVEI